MLYTDTPEVAVAFSKVAISVKLLYDNSIAPSYTRSDDAAMDLTVASVTVTEKYVEYDMGVAIAIPPGYAGFIFARSSISNRPAILANAVGVVESSYRGPLLVRMYHPDENYYKVGERAAQLLVLSIPKINVNIVDQLGETERGTQGFGSSDGQKA